MNDNQILCTICENNGYLRYNCTNDMIVGDLQRIVTDIDDLLSRRNEIERIFNNIRDHTTDNFDNIQMLALLAYLIVEKNSSGLNVNMNKHITIKIEEKKNEEPFECAVCMENIPRFNSLTFDCNHYFCGECVITNIQKEKHLKQLRCYLCRHSVENINIHDDKNIYDKLKEQLDT